MKLLGTSPKQNEGSDRRPEVAPATLTENPAMKRKNERDNASAIIWK